MLFKRAHFWHLLVKNNCQIKEINTRKGHRGKNKGNECTNKRMITQTKQMSTEIKKLNPQLKQMNRQTKNEYANKEMNTRRKVIGRK